VVPVPTEDELTDQAYIGVNVPSSTSEPDAEQLSTLPTTTPELGETVAEVTVGEVFPTSTPVEDVTVPPAESVAVAVHVIVEPTSVSEAVTTYVGLVETVEELTVQA